MLSLRFALRSAVLVSGLGLSALIGWRLAEELSPADDASTRADRAAPVEVATARRTTLRDLRTFGGSLLPESRFVVAPKVGGRVEWLAVDLGDEVARGTVLARLDDEEFRQAVAEAEAELGVARAQLAVAESAARLAESSSERVLELEQRKIASGSAVDLAAADLASTRARVQVAAAQVARAEAALAAARIRLGYTEVVATWPEEGPATLRVSRRDLDPGAVVMANDPIVEVVDSSRLRAVFFATERDHALLRTGQSVVLATDAYPDREFTGRVRRISPLFEESSRQTRVEVEVDNTDEALKPGIYVRLSVEMRTLSDALTVPFAAIVRRRDVDGVFAVQNGVARWTPVRLGLRQDDLVALLAPAPSGDSRVETSTAGRAPGASPSTWPGSSPDAETSFEPPLRAGTEVVTLGQQLCEDGARVSIRSRYDGSSAAAGADAVVVETGPLGAGD